MNIPNLPPLSTIVDENGVRTPVEQVFMQQLITELQNNAGPQGLVAPTVTNAQIALIENNKDILGNYTLQPGTIVYNSDRAGVPLTSMMIAVPNFGIPPVQFKTVTLT